MKYEKTKNIVIIFLMMLVVLAFSGCGQNNVEDGINYKSETKNDDGQNQNNQLNKNTFDSSLHTCEAYSGYSCKVSEVCNAELYEATDVVICCSELCEKELFEIETFEPVEENEEELGEII